VTEPSAKVRRLNDIVFSAEDVVDFVGASLAEGGCGTVKERFGQFLFAARTGLHFLHVWLGASSYCSMTCSGIIPKTVNFVTGAITIVGESLVRNAIKR
jgi:heme/copper-type cytochrome/quinol oxidase subunit 3